VYSDPFRQAFPSARALLSSAVPGLRTFAMQHPQHRPVLMLQVPIEIWRLVARELTGGVHAFSDLLRFAQTCWAFADLALPELYAVYRGFEQLGEDFDKEEDDAFRHAFCAFWRSIVSSCLGTTLFPYFLWITRLDLENLYQYISKLKPLRPEDLIDFFGGHPLESLGIRQDEINTLDHDVVVSKIADLLCKATLEASNEGRPSRIAELHVMSLSPACLERLVTVLPNLTEIVCVGPSRSLLNGDIGTAIRTNCPKFRSV
jgi:hypothetical protein